MDSSKVSIRRVRKEDDAFLLKLNERNVEVLSPMDVKQLEMFQKHSELFLVAQIGCVPVAFLIALRENVPCYRSENYLWFRQRYERFLYVDRIVIDDTCRGMGVGRILYQYVFSHARSTGVPVVTAEIDTEPYNDASLKFHMAMGFHEVGKQQVRDNTIAVSLQEKEIE